MGKMISEISSLSCNTLEELRKPTVLGYVPCLTSFRGFESHSSPSSATSTRQLVEMQSQQSRASEVIENLAAKRRKTTHFEASTQLLALPKCFGISGPF